MVHVRVVRMIMDQRLVHVNVRVGFPSVPGIVRVLMMFVMPMGVHMFQVLVDVLVRVAFADMQP